MDMGTLPEWFTACAELLAVCTALFLPQFNAYRARKESLARMRRVTTGMLEALLADRRSRADADPASLESAKDLDLYLRIAFFALSDARELALRDEVDGLYRRLMAPDPDLPALRGRIKALRGEAGEP